MTTRKKSHIMEITITLTGTAPLLMHNIQAANPLHPLAKEMKAISSNRTLKKTDEGIEQLARLDWTAGLYFDEAYGPILPAENMTRCLIEGGRVTKQGKNVERALLILDDSPLAYPGPRDIDALWEDGSFAHTSMVRVGQSRVPRVRPIFREWAAEFDADLDTEVLNLSDLQTIAERAGRSVGVGDFRPRYGRFDVAITRKG